MFARSVLLAVLFIYPVAGLAEPAVVRQFEAPARAEPDPKAAVIHVFVEGATVSVSEDPIGGYRKVRLPDGRVGYVEESALTFPKKEPAAAANPSETRPPASPNTVTSMPGANADLRPRIYVKDLDHLAELVQVDEVVGPMANSLTRRRTTAIVAGLAGVAAGGVVFFTGLGKKSCQQDQYCVAEPTQSIVGIGIVSASALVWWIITPGRKDLIDVINSWNTRHVDRQFELTGSARPAQ